MPLCSHRPVPSVHRDQRLRFAARKQRRAVGARQYRGLNRDRSNLVERAAVWPHPVFGHLLAEDLLPQQLVILRELLLGPTLFLLRAAA